MTATDGDNATPPASDTPAHPVNLRQSKRVAYEALVGVVLREPNGGRSEPMVLRAGDISAGGVSVVSSTPLRQGAEGVMQIVRPDGQYAIVGIRVCHCRYDGSMEHVSGMQFIPLPEGFTRHEFLDENGRVALLDPLLKQNAG